MLARTLRRSVFGATALLTSMLPLQGCSGYVDDVPNQRPGLDAGAPSTPSRRRCEDPKPGAHPLRRMTTHQYEVMVGRLFGDIRVDDLGLPEVTVGRHGYDNDAVLASPTANGIEAYYTAARRVAARAVAQDGWRSCNIDESGCALSALLQVAEGAKRGPLDADERTAFEGFVAAQLADGWTSREVLEMGIEAVLQTPSFLYYPEAGDPSRTTPDGLIALTPAELANRLSLFLWDEPADDALRAQASEAWYDDGALRTQIEAMIADPRIEAGFERFAAQWMPLRGEAWGDSLFRDPAVAADEGLRADLRASALRFLRYAFLEGDIDALLTSRTGFVNDRIAGFFGIDAPGSSELVAVELPEAQRAGILTHPAVLAMAPSDATFYSVYRGVMVMNQMLCIPPGLPQFDMINVSEGQMSGRTSRERLSQEHLSGSCNSCHETIDGIGFAFGNFDALGRWRDDEFGIPVDASGQLFGTSVGGPIDLVQEMATREEVAYCITKHFYSYAVGRGLTEDPDLCQAQLLADDLMAADGNLPGLALAIALSPSFRHLTPEL